MSKTIPVLALLISYCGGQTSLLAQRQSLLKVSAPDLRVQLTFTLDGDSKRGLEQSLNACRPIEVRYIAELRKQRMFWPDLSFARTMIRNRVVCDEKSRSRTLQRIVDGSIVAGMTATNHEAVLAFMTETGDVSAFQGVRFPSYSYSVRVRSELVTAPDQVRQTGVLARTQFDIR